MSMMSAMLGSQGFTLSSFGANISNTGASSGTYHASVTLNTDGTTALSPGGATGNWGKPTIAGIGSSYWARITVNLAAGSATYAGTLPVNTWSQINTNRSFDVSNSLTGGEATGSFLIEFSTDGGSTTCGSQGGSFDVGRAN